MSSYIFDTHSHYDDKAFDSDCDEILGGLLAKGIGKVVDVGADMPSSKMALELAKQYEFVYAALGVHPSEVEGLTEDDMAWISSHAAHEKVAAIGEIGLDYHWPEPKPALQKQWFRRQIELAKEVKLPIIVHSRDAAEPTMQIIQETKAYECGGVIHCYSYSPEMAEEYVKMGFFIGMGGVLTFKNAKKLVRCAERIPLSSIVLETDCPYMAPEPNRGKRNDSSQLIYVAQKLAEIKGITEEEVKQATTENAHRLYRLTQNK
jgi:TatD DNase family protein